MNKRDLLEEAEYLLNVAHGAMHEHPAGLRTLNNPSTIYRLYSFLKQAVDVIRGGSSKPTTGRSSRAPGITRRRKNR